jgi:hypothetical protein
MSSVYKNENNVIDSYCGFNCYHCDSYIATKNNDIKLKEKVAQRWYKKFDKQFRVEDVYCYGCKSSDERLAYCANFCKLRKCAIDMKVISCAYCSKYPCDYYENKEHSWAKKYVEKMRDKI